MLFARAGYHHESEEYGNSKYVTFGAGVVYKNISVDFSYLAPTGSKYNSMGNTLRVSLAVNF